MENFSSTANIARRWTIVLVRGERKGHVSREPLPEVQDQKSEMEMRFDPPTILSSNAFASSLSLSLSLVIMIEKESRRWGHRINVF